VRYIIERFNPLLWAIVIFSIIAAEAASRVLKIPKQWHEPFILLLVFTLLMFYGRPYHANKKLFWIGLPIFAVFQCLACFLWDAFWGLPAGHHTTRRYLGLFIGELLLILIGLTTIAKIRSHKSSGNLS
jgi:hypothetical protein